MSDETRLDCFLLTVTDIPPATTHNQQTVASNEWPFQISQLLSLGLSVLSAASLLRLAVIGLTEICPETPPEHQKFPCSGTAVSNKPFGELNTARPFFRDYNHSLCSPPLPRKHLSAPRDCALEA